MSRFFFDLIWKGLRIPDESGLDLGPGLAVRNAAIHAVTEHAIDVSPDEQGRHEVQVRDAEGALVFDVILEYAGSAGRPLHDPLPE